MENVHLQTSITMSVKVPQEWRPIPRSIRPTWLVISSMKMSWFEVVNVNCFTKMLLNSASSARFLRISVEDLQMIRMYSVIVF